MNYLAFDTSGNHLTVVVKSGDEVFCEYLPDCHLQHSVSLMPTVERVLEKANKTVKDMDLFACSVGAGSFTGIRIGVSAVKAFSYALDKPVLSVTSFDALAYNNLSDGKVLAVIDARHGHVYACGYEGEKVILDPCYITVEEAKNLSATYKTISLSPIEGLDVTVVDVKEGFIKAVTAKAPYASPDRETLVPLYIRKSQAEEGL